MNIVLLSTLLAHALANPGYLVAPIERTTASSGGIKEVDKDRGFVPQVLKNRVFMYLATFKLGGQTQSAIIDTGSADLWVFDSKTGAAMSYDTETGQNLRKPFTIRYVDGTTANGEYYLDDFAWGDINVKLQFGVSRKRSPRASYGVFGIAARSREAAVDYDENNAYENLPSVLRRQGLTHSNSYSINLSDVDKDSGTIVFGAFDTSRFTGMLKAYDVDTSKGFQVPFTVNGYRQIADLDSGTSLSYLDRWVVYDIATSLGAKWDEESQAFGINEPPASDLVFNFDGVDITVPPSELWQEYPIENDIPYRYYLTILPNFLSRGVNLLGDSFLRSAYVIYDLDNEQVAIGQANPNPGPSHYVTISDEGVPSEYIV